MEKIFTNAGYFDGNNSKFNQISKSSAAHNVLIVDDNHPVNSKRIQFQSEVENGLK